jgi:hypothetical protein
MRESERKVVVACKTRDMVEREAREDISRLCGELSGRVGDYKKVPDVLKSIVELNRAMEIYIDELRMAKDDYETAVKEYAEDVWQRRAF